MSTKCKKRNGDTLCYGPLSTAGSIPLSPRALSMQHRGEANLDITIAYTAGWNTWSDSTCSDFLLFKPKPCFLVKAWSRCKKVKDRDLCGWTREEVDGVKGLQCEE